MVTVLVLAMRWSALSVDWAYAIVGSSAVRRSSSCRITGDLGGLRANMTEDSAPHRGDLGPMDDRPSGRRRAQDIFRGRDGTSMDLNINGALRAVDANPDTPLLYVLRNDLGLYGTRF